MAQALLNNLNNIVSTDGIFAAGNQQEESSEVANFGAILDARTAEASESETTAAEIDVEVDVKTDTDVDKTVQVIEETAAVALETLADVVKETELAAAIEYVADVVSEEIAETESEDSEITTDEQDVVKEETASDETVAEDTVREEENEEENRGIDGDSASEDETEETNTIINNTDTITDEAPTMNTKRTLENPAAVIIPHTQQTQSKQVQETKVTELSYLNQRTVQTQSDKIVTPDTGKTQQQTNDTNIKTLKDLVSENMIKDLKIQSVEGSSTQSESSGEFVQYQTPQEQAVKIMLHSSSDIKFEDIKVVSQKQVEATASRILEQITKQMEGMNSSSRLNMVLNPEHLGKVALKIINSKDGLLAQFTVTNPDTQNILLKGIAGLKESLLTQGINVGNVIVKVGEAESGESEYNPDWTEQDGSGSHGQREQGSGRNKEKEKNFEQMMFEITNS